MIEFLRLILHIIASFFKPRTKLLAEILILRQQLNVLRRQVSKRPQLSNTDRFLFVWLYRWFSSVLSAIAILRPMVQLGQDWDRDNGTGALDCPTGGRVVAKRQVRAHLIVVGLKISTRSKHSRRTVPIKRSAYGFCHGDPGEIGRSRIPMARTRDLNTCP